PQSSEISDSYILTKRKSKTEKSKGGRPKMPIWDDYSEGEEDGHGHYGANCHYCDKGRWQRGKPSVMEAHLALHCKGPVPEDIRKKWLIEVAKRGEKANNDKDDDVPIGKKVKTVNQSITSHYRPVNMLSSQQSADITKALLKAF
ncbi:1478_t:CDS:1, partial [Racocetra fulgida]